MTDYNGCATIEEVQERVANQGSRWYFYPFAAVILDNGRSYTTGSQRIVEADDPISEWRGRAIRTVSRALASMSSDERLDLPF